jgi:hypothetical protein
MFVPVGSSARFGGGPVLGVVPVLSCVLCCVYDPRLPVPGPVRIGCELASRSEQRTMTEWSARGTAQGFNVGALGAVRLMYVMYMYSTPSNYSPD